MARVKFGKVTRARRKRWIKRAKGYYGLKNSSYKKAHEQVVRSMNYAYVGRKEKKRDFRKLWIARINAAVRPYGLSYSRFMFGLKEANVDINRKMLSELAISNPSEFETIVHTVQQTLNQPQTNSTAKPVKLPVKKIVEPTVKPKTVEKTETPVEKPVEKVKASVKKATVKPAEETAKPKAKAATAKPATKKTATTTKTTTKKVQVEKPSVAERAKTDGSLEIKESETEIIANIETLVASAQAKDIKVKAVDFKEMTKKELLKYMKSIATKLKKVQK